VGAVLHLTYYHGNKDAFELSFQQTALKLLLNDSLMTNMHFSSLEILEERIAPAGLITTTFLHGVLTVNGADGASHNVNIVKTGPLTFSVEGNSTNINTVGQASINYRGPLISIDLEGGSGNDTFVLTNLSPLRSLVFNGNGGTDSLSASNFVNSVGGYVDISFASGSGSVAFSGSKTDVARYLDIDLGAGGTIDFGAITTIVNGNVALTGAGGSDSVSFPGATTLLRSGLTFTGGTGNDSFSSTGKSFAVLGASNLAGGPDTNTFDFAATASRFGSVVQPALTLNLGSGPGTVTFTGTSDLIVGNMAITAGAGGGTAQLNSGVTTVTGSVQLTGGPGNDTLAFSGRTSIGKSLSFTGNGGSDALTATGTLFSVKGATTVDGSEGTNAFNLDVAGLSLAALSFTGGPQNDTVSIIANGTITGNTSLNLGIDGTGPSAVTLQSYTPVANGLRLGGTLNISMTGATVDALTLANIEIAKGLVAQTGDNVSTINISGLNTPADFNLNSGDGADNVNISNIRTLDFTLNNGSGADNVNIDNFHVRDFNVNTGIGADVLSIETNSSYAGASQVLGTTNIQTGIGADNILIGNASTPADTKVFFMGPVTVDGGPGANTINDIVACNYFKDTPTIIASGGGTFTPAA